jgi:membrane protein
LFFLLINKIEIDLNALLRARPNRNLLTRAGIYFGILIFGTLTIGSSFTITNDLIELMTLKLPQEYSLLETVLTSLVSIFLIGLTIFLLMMLVSSAKIQLRSALWGAFWGAIFWEAAKKGFSLWAHYSIRVSVIYGSFFLIPLLFIWIQLAWIIILSSLEIAYFHQHPDYLLLMEENKRAPSFQALMTIELFQQIKMEWDIQNSSVPLEHLADCTGLPEEEILHLVNRLKRYKLVNGDDRKGYIPVKESVEEEKLMYAALDRDGVNNQKSLHKNVIEIWNRFLDYRK